MYDLIEAVAKKNRYLLWPGRAAIQAGCGHFENDLSLSGYYRYFTMASKIGSHYIVTLKDAKKHIPNLNATLFWRAAATHRLYCAHF